jgi:DNA-binding transcriptional MerR regulator
MRIQQIATLTGASQKAVRLYEALGLLGPVPRRGAYRFYSADHVALVAMVRRAQAFGFTLAELRAAQRGGQIDWAAVLQLVQDKRRALAAERARLARMDQELQAIEDELRPCAAAAAPPPPHPAASCLASVGHQPPEAT